MRFDRIRIGNFALQEAAISTTTGGFDSCLSYYFLTGSSYPDFSRTMRLFRSSGILTGAQAGGEKDHVDYTKPGNPNIITIDIGRKEMPKPIYQRIKKMAGWE